MDANWSWSGERLYAAGSVGFYQAEVDFGMSFDGDSIIGDPGGGNNPGGGDIEAVGGYALSFDALNQLSARSLSTSASSPVMRGGSRVTNDTFPGWTPKAAELLGGQNQMVWVADNGTMARWTLDANWSWSGERVYAAGSVGFYQAEVDFGMSFDGNGIVGA